MDPPAPITPRNQVKIRIQPPDLPTAIMALSLVNSRPRLKITEILMVLPRQLQMETHLQIMVDRDHLINLQVYRRREQ